MESAKTTNYKGKSPEELAEMIKAIARNIRDSSTQVRETVKTLRESGGLQELTEAVNMAAIAARDTAKDINDTARELQESGVLDETRAAVEETASSAKDTARRVKDEATKTAEGMKKTTGDLKSYESKPDEKPAGTT